MKKGFLVVVLGLVAGTVSAGPDWAERVAQAANGAHRSEANRARNAYRHPVETLAFFGFDEGDHVLEIWPGNGWYTEILAPAIRNHGQFSIATWDQDVADQPDYRYQLPAQLNAKFEANPELYDQVRTVYYSPPQSASLGAAGSYDLILTFRNAHGWVGDGIAQDVFQEFARVLKPGGELGIVQHRAAEGSDPSVTAQSGYVSEQHIKRLAADAGLEFVAASEVNANPLDSKDHPEGVWTLPPGFAMGDTDREKYAAIGESDRMTLKFRKPAKH